MNGRVYLVRHAESLPRTGRPSEGEAVGLSAKGKVQAQRVARLLMHRGVKQVVSSPFARAKETADSVAKVVGSPVVIDDRAREFVAANLSGPAFKEARDRARREQDWCGEDGESFHNSIERLTTLIDSLPFDGSTVVLTHELLLQNLLLSLGAEKRSIPHTGMVVLHRTSAGYCIDSVTRRSLLDRILRRR